MSKVNSFNLSMPQSCTVRGCEIKRAPLGAFLQALKLVEDFPPQMMEAVFPQMSLREIVLMMKSGSQDMLWQIFTRALMIVPDQAVKLIAQLTMIPESKLNNDPNIGADGIVEIVNAWYEVNRIESFFVNALGLYQKLRALTKSPMNTGSST
jgi:hypothetical protein